jgi:hypothetical protein
VKKPVSRFAFQVHNLRRYTGGGAQGLYLTYPERVGGVARTPGGCQLGYMGDQNSTYGLRSLPGDVRLVAWTTPAVTVFSLTAEY